MSARTSAAKAEIEKKATALEARPPNLNILHRWKAYPSKLVAYPPSTVLFQRTANAPESCEA